MCIDNSLQHIHTDLFHKKYLCVKGTVDHDALYNDLTAFGIEVRVRMVLTLAQIQTNHTREILQEPCTFFGLLYIYIIIIYILQ
jgi:hypothetical protein